MFDSLSHTVARGSLKRIIGRDLPPTSSWGAASFEDRATLIHAGPLGHSVHLNVPQCDLRQKRGDEGTGNQYLNFLFSYNAMFVL